MRTVKLVGGLPILCRGRAVVRFINARSVDTQGAAIRLVNVNTLGNARHSVEYHQGLFDEASVSVLDSTPLAWLMRVVGRPVEVLRGPDLFRLCIDSGRDVGVRHFLLGGTPESLLALQAVLRRDYPGALIVGAASPPFRDMSEEERSIQDRMIAALAPDVVWVGTGGMKQDVEALRLSRTMGLCAVGVGAAFDFVSGTKQEAPKFLQGSGLEWLFRLLNEPGRLLARYSVNAVRAVLWLAFGPRKRPGESI